MLGIEVSFIYGVIGWRFAVFGHFYFRFSVFGPFYFRFAVSKNDAICGLWPILYSVYGFYPILNAVYGFWSFLNAVCGIGKNKENSKRPATIPLSTFYSYKWWIWRHFQCDGERGSECSAWKKMAIVAINTISINISIDMVEFWLNHKSRPKHELIKKTRQESGQREFVVATLRRQHENSVDYHVLYLLRGKAAVTQLTILVNFKCGLRFLAIFRFGFRFLPVFIFGFRFLAVFIFGLRFREPL